MASSTERARTWRQRHPDQAISIVRRYRAQVGVGDHHRQPWTDKEIDRIMADDRPDDVTLARELGRTITGVQNKRFKIRREEQAQEDSRAQEV